ncbi:MAG: hypothetical protein QMD80_00810 [archaeon]|nr:hypothetical protein [archaeon]
MTTPNIHSLSYIKWVLLGKPKLLSDFIEHIYAWDISLLKNLFNKLDLHLKTVECGYADPGLKFHDRLLRNIRPDFAWFIYVIAKKI